MTVTTTGTAGAATGSANTKAIRGKILRVVLNFHASAPATTDTTISTAYPITENILVVTSSVTDASFYPRAKPVDNANAAITNAFTELVVDGTVTVSLAQCDALTGAVVADIYYEKN